MFTADEICREYRAGFALQGSKFLCKSVRILSEWLDPFMGSNRFYIPIYDYELLFTAQERAIITILVYNILYKMLCTTADILIRTNISF